MSLRRQMTSVEQRLNASREVRRQHPVMATRSFSPLSPLIRRMNSLENVSQPLCSTRPLSQPPHFAFAWLLYRYTHNSYSKQPWIEHTLSRVHWSKCTQLWIWPKKNILKRVLTMWNWAFHHAKKNMQLSISYYAQLWAQLEMHFPMSFVSFKERAMNGGFLGRE